MVADSRIDALERRMTTAESQIEGEKNVSRYAADQARRGTEAFLALRSEVAALRADIAGTTARVDSLGEDMSIVKAALVRHRRALDILMQDVGLLRGEMATRQEVATLRQEMVALREEMVALREEMATRQEIAALREEMAIRHTEILAAIHALASDRPSM